MIRIILVAMTVVLYLIFSVPVLTMLRLRAKKDPVGVQEKSLSKIQGVFRFILKLAGVIRGAGAGEHTVRQGCPLCGEPQELF